MDFRGKVILAPMADYTDYTYRNIMREFGAVYTYTEMVSSDAIAKGSIQGYGLLPHENEKNIGIQLFGSDINNMVFSAEQVKKSGTWIDINAGCPVKKVVNRGAGAALLKDLPKLSDMIFSMKKVLDIPLGVKVRIGYSNVDIFNIHKAVEKAGADYIIIHGRTRDQLYTGISDRKIISDIRKISNIPVGGSGDVFKREDIDYYLNYISDFVIVARGSIGNPWIFSDYEPTCDERKKVCISHAENYVKVHSDEGVAMARFRKYLAHYFENYPGVRELRRNLNNIHTVDQMKNLINEIFPENK
ncbi:MAG TPA: tRNA-dihydrouridine synthase [Tepiditoga sp.]|nr:tRNA-dihydrouridine synthase [Tepiditoga sp.]